VNILKRNKEIILRHENGEKLIDIAKDYGIHQCSISNYYYSFLELVNEPFYDLVAALDVNDQVAVKLVNALARYERDICCDLDAKFIRHMKRDEFADCRGVGVAIMNGFDMLQESLK
jgi:hypothetical protein